MSVANERLLPLTFELVPNLGQAIPNGTVATYRFVDANSGVIESLNRALALPRIARYTTHFYAQSIVRIFPVHSKGAGRALPLLLGGRERRLGAWNMADWLASPFALQPKPRRPRSQSS